MGKKIFTGFYQSKYQSKNKKKGRRLSNKENRRKDKLYITIIKRTLKKALIKTRSNESIIIRWDRRSFSRFWSSWGLMCCYLSLWANSEEICCRQLHPKGSQLHCEQIERPA
jgi:hypothetical protein